MPADNVTLKGLEKQTAAGVLGPDYAIKLCSHSEVQNVQSPNSNVFS